MSVWVIERLKEDSGNWLPSVPFLYYSPALEHLKDARKAQEYEDFCDYYRLVEYERGRVLDE